MKHCIVKELNELFICMNKMLDEFIILFKFADKTIIEHERD